MKFLKKKVLKCLRASKFVEICLLRTATIPQLIEEVVKVVYIGLLRPAIIAQEIMEVVNVGQVLPTTLPIVTTEYRLIEVDKGQKIT